MGALGKKIVSLRKQGLGLEEILVRILPMFSNNFQDESWNSLDINYHPPRVMRLWSQHGSMRLMVHLIEKTDAKDALFHPHPWPSAVMVIGGCYEMGIGYGASAEEPPVAAKVFLRAGSSYEMTDKNSWHYVAPIRWVQDCSLSLMLIDSPWETPHPFYSEGEKVRLNPLTENDRNKVIDAMHKCFEELEIG